MREGYAWWHVRWHTYGAWLPGDPRGFRNRDHRIHSSGDYKKPPPVGEHAGLYRYARRVSGPETVLATPWSRQTVLQSLLLICAECNCFPVAIAVCRVHVHLLAEMRSKSRFSIGLSRASKPNHPQPFETNSPAASGRAATSGS